MTLASTSGRNQSRENSTVSNAKTSIFKMKREAGFGEQREAGRCSFQQMLMFTLSGGSGRLNDSIKR